MIEIEYTIGELTTQMFVKDCHFFRLTDEDWIKANDLTAGDNITATSGAKAQITRITKIEGRHQCRDLKISHNHNYFVTKPRVLADDIACDKVPTDPLELVAYTLANKPSQLPDGQPTGYHSGPWVAATCTNIDSNIGVIGWGRANDKMCAEDAAVSDLRKKLGDAIDLHRNNVQISHAYIRKYTRKGRFVNKMSPCIHCRKNYGKALNDDTVGVSDLSKTHRDYLPHKDK